MIQRTAVRLMIGIGVPIASALVMEQLPRTRVAQVPFAFQIDQRTLPPGTYAVTRAKLGRSIRFQNEKLADAEMECAGLKHKFGKAAPARLVFDSYQGRYLLSEVWFDSEGQGLVLRRKNPEQVGLAGRVRETKSVSLQ